MVSCRLCILRGLASLFLQSIDALHLLLRLGLQVLGLSCQSFRMLFEALRILDQLLWRYLVLIIMRSWRHMVFGFWRLNKPLLVGVLSIHHHIVQECGTLGCVHSLAKLLGHGHADNDA